MKQPSTLEAALRSRQTDPEADRAADGVADMKQRALEMVRLELDALEQIQAKAHRDGKSLTRAQASTLRALLTTLSMLGPRRRKGGRPPWPSHPKDGS